MKRRFDIDDYLGNYVMHCSTEDEANVFLKYLNSVGRRWRNGASYLAFKVCKENIVYYFNNGTFGNYDSVSCEYVILEFDAFDWSERQPLQGSDLLQLLEAEGITGEIKRCLI